MEAEACRRDHDHPKDRLRRGIVSARNHPDSSGAATQKLQKIVMDSLSLEQMYDGSQFQQTMVAAMEDLQNTTDIFVVMQCDSKDTENDGCPAASAH